MSGHRLPRFASGAVLASLGAFLAAGCGGHGSGPAPHTGGGDDDDGGVEIALRSTIEPGAYNTPQRVELVASEGASIRFSLDSADPGGPGGREYAGPIDIAASATVTAVAVASERRSPVLTLRFTVLEAPTLAADGRFVTLHESPIRQDLSRIAFLDAAPGRAPALCLSTLESYGKPEGDSFLLYRHDLAGGGTVPLEVRGSIEARSKAYCRSLERHVLGASLDPQVILYDPASGSAEVVFSRPGAGAWIHKLAVSGTTAYTVLSTPAQHADGFDGLLRIDLTTKAWTVIPFPEPMDQGWGGAQTVDPTGRVWLYRAYPLRLLWHDGREGMRPRRIAGYEDWTVESWDAWLDAFFVVLTRPPAEIAKVRVDPTSLSELPPLAARPGSPGELFLRLLPVDLYHQGGDAIACLYHDPSTATFHRVNGSRGTIELVAAAPLGRLELTGFLGSPMEEAVRWVHPERGITEILGLDGDGGLVLWFRGKKRYGLWPPAASEPLVQDVLAPNLSPAEVTSLARDAGGVIHGGGYLTSTNLFRLDPRTGAVSVLQQAIPFAEGQVNALFEGVDGRLYGAAYPGSVPFRYDPALPWSPGRERGSNPLNAGPLGGDQHVARLGVQDLDGSVWLESRSEYTARRAHALARVRFDDLSVTVKTDLGDGFPVVRGLVVLDREHLLLLGAASGKGEGDRGGSPNGAANELVVLDQRRFEVVERRPAPGRGGLLVNLDPARGAEGPILLAQGRMVSSVLADLTLQPIHEAVAGVARLLAGLPGEVIVLGKASIEMFRTGAPTWEVWWAREDVRGEWVFRDLYFAPAVPDGDALILGDEARLRRFVRPVR